MLRGIPANIRNRGEAYLASGAVGPIKVVEPGHVWRTRVRGSAKYRVELMWDEEFGWDVDCDCPYDYGLCKHAYAALQKLITVHEQVVGQPAKWNSDKKQKPEPWQKLRSVLREATGGEITREQAEHLNRIANFYWNLKQGRSVLTGSSLTQLGFGPVSNQWNTLNLWEKFPENDHLFWLHMVAYMRRHGVAVPECLGPVSDTAPIAETLRRFERRQLVANWKRHLQQAQNEEPDEPERKLDPVTVEIRLRLTDDHATVELKESETDDYRPLKQKELRRLSSRFKTGEVCLPAAQELLWTHLEYWNTRGYDTQWRMGFDNVDFCNTLYAIFGNASLRGLVWTAAGSQLLWSTDRLVWQVLPGEGVEKDDYLLQLAHADGSRADQVDLVLDGAPAMYVLGDTLHPGPSTDYGRLDPYESQLIPSEVVETKGGVKYLHRLGARLPEVLQRRIRTVRLRPRLLCQLEDKYQEQCDIEILAVDDEGNAVSRWKNGSWTKAGKGRAKKGATKAVLIEDKHQLNCVPEIMDPLRATPHWGTGHYQLTVNRNFPERFNEWLDGLPNHVEVQLLGDLAGFADGSLTGSVSFEVEENEIDWFDLKVVLDVGDLQLSQEEIKLLLKAKGNWVRLAEHGWRRLQFDLSAEDDRQLAQLGLNAGELAGEPQRLHALQLANPAARKFLPEEQSVQLTRRAEEIQARVTPDIPAAIDAELRPYQADGFRFLAYLSTNRFGGILADDMGLGKTLQTLTWLTWMRANGETGPVLVVCPKSVMDNWQAETARFTRDISARVWQRGEIDNLPKQADTADLHVINYNQLRRLGESLRPVRFLAVILDEGQYIKNPSSQTAQAARSLVATHRIVLTGTPIENRLLDLWSLLSFAMPGVLGSRKQFGKLYNAKDDPLARLRLSSRVRPFLIRRTKAQVADDLPARIEEDLYCEMEGEQKKLYQAERKRAQQILLGIETQQQLNELRFNFLTSLLHLRQICCHPRLFREGSKDKSAKLDALVEQLDPIMSEGNKVLVFSQFVELLELIDTRLREENWQTWKLTGGTEKRGKLVEKFQAHNGPGVFLISLKAGGSGLNLTAASYVVLFDPWWNPAVENQAIDRTHRIGQTTKVIAYRLLIKNSIEEKIRELQKQKQALAQDILGEEKFSAALTLSDFQYLLSD